MHEVCPHCGRESNEESPRFCSGCGFRMDGTLPSGPTGYAAPVTEQKSTSIAGFCSSVLPGLGQVYNGETAKGFVLLILTLAGLVLLVIPGLIVWIYAMYDAYSIASKMNSGEIPFRETRTIHMVLFIFFAVVIVIVAIFAIIALVMTAVTAQFGSLDLPGTGNFGRMPGSGGLF
jgi:TM2 domain-containing membrane protein YozV